MNHETQIQRNNRQIAIWLLTGVGMIVIQVVLGGVTRLTESGLSITEWKPITGALPPLNEAAWMVEFEKYRHTDQFKFVHQSFSLNDFKFIFFWEWFHRLWARTMGMVFLIGFVYFLVKRKFNRQMVLPMIILFILGGVQGAIGWIMVKSGLVPEKYFVGHVELTTHFIAALILLTYTLWFTLGLFPSFNNKIHNQSIRNLLYFIAAVFFVQLAYGGFMAGLKAAQSAPTWPTINGKWLPDFSEHKLQIHFIHRGVAYLLLLLSIIFFFKSRKETAKYHLFSFFSNTFLLLILLQVILGVCALLWATIPNAFIWFGILHQFNAILILITLTTLIYIVRKPNVA
jgi:cytochrome c oxidase assembly protein subunit 15